MLFLAAQTDQQPTENTANGWVGYAQCDATFTVSDPPLFLVHSTSRFTLWSNIHTLVKVITASVSIED